MPRDWKHFRINVLANTYNTKATILFKKRTTKWQVVTQQTGDYNNIKLPKHDKILYLEKIDVII